MKRLLTILKYVFFLSLGIVLLYFAFRNTDPRTMMEEIREANYFWVIASVASGIISYYSRAARWLILLEPLGYKPKFSNSIYSVFFGYFANIAAPRIGELARCTALNQTEKIPINTLIGTVILERAIDVVILLLLVVVSFFLNAQLFGDFFIDIFRNKLQITFNPGMMLAVVFAITFVMVCMYLLRKKIMQVPLAVKVKTFLKGIMEGFTSIAKMKKKWQFVLHTAAIWFAYVLMTYIGFFALKETSSLSFSDGIFITVAGGMGMAVPANGGIGTYHAAVMFGLAAVGIEKSAGLVFATLMHASQVLFIILTGSFSFVMLYIEKNKRNSNPNPASQ